MWVTGPVNAHPNEVACAPDKLYSLSLTSPLKCGQKIEKHEVTSLDCRIDFRKLIFILMLIEYANVCGLPAVRNIVAKIRMILPGLMQGVVNFSYPPSQFIQLEE